MVTYSGVRVEPASMFGGQYANTPGIRDLAIGQYRMCRYGGHTNTWWSVLQHALACAVYADRKGLSVNTRLELLLHDAHEAVTADIPSSWKTDSMRVLQDELDQRIHEHYGLSYPLIHADKQWVKDIDHEILLAEAKLFGPPGITAFLLAPDALSLSAVAEILKLTKEDDPRRIDGSITIKMYLDCFATLIGQIE